MGAVIADMLAGDARTTAGALRVLCDRGPHPLVTALALATHPNLPADTRPHLTRTPVTDLAAALGEPSLPARVRAGFLRDVRDTPAMFHLIALYDCLSTAEIQLFHDTQQHDATGGYRYYARNALSPAPLAHRGIAALNGREHLPAPDPATQRPLTTQELTADLIDGGWDVLAATAAAIRHGQAIAAGDAHERVTGPRACALYAKVVLDYLRTCEPARRAGWWPVALRAMGDPSLARAALDDLAGMSREDVGDHVRHEGYATLRAIPRIPAALREEAALALLAASPGHPALVGHYDSATAAANAAAVLQHEHLETGTLSRISRNLATDSATLGSIYRATRPNGPSPAPEIGSQVALHPHTGATTRAAALRDLAEDSPRRRAAYGCPHLVDLVNHLAPTGAATGAALLGAPATLVADAHAGRAGALVRYQLTAAPLFSGPIDAGHAHALLTLEAARFPGTLGQLLTTAAGIAD